MSGPGRLTGRAMAGLLRERRPDIPDLARHLLGRAARRPVDQVANLLTPESIDTLLEYDWPGNVREL